jgi:hypothetical protein
MLLTAVLIPAHEDGLVAFKSETGTTTQVASGLEAIRNLRTATELYPEELPFTQSGQPLLTTSEVSAHA